jgi:hypothetical protein
MCCFSGPVTSVRATNIFARALPDQRQALVYSMSLNTPKDVAMILPLPVAEGSGEDALKFVSFEKYPDFFSDLNRCFPQARSFKSDAPLAAAAGPLKVHEVGNFNASFIPTVKDFSRVDRQFRLPDGVWEKLGDYAKYGFAVFKLRKGDAKVHPMAFTFPSAMPGKLFFPTVHIHDGEVHPKADFDHVLYAQPSPRGLVEPHRWVESEVPASSKLAIGKCGGLVHAQGHVHRRVMSGQLKNVDVIVGV